MHLSIVIPCYNEVDNADRIICDLLPVVRELGRSYSEELVFVDDGSTDGTLDRLKTAVKEREFDGVPVHFIRVEGNWGLGNALRAGFAASSGDVILTTDSDGTYPFSSIPTLLSYLTEDVDVVTASPYHPDGGIEGVPTYRVTLSRGSSFLYRVLVDRRLRTYTCLFRAYRRGVVEDIQFVSNGFLAVTELLVKCMLRGYRVAEYPATLRSRAVGSSKARLVRIILAHLRFQFAVLLHRTGLCKLARPLGNQRGREWIVTKYSVGYVPNARDRSE